ncbi:hypothetical protein ACLOJK_014569, partial [Asimina triloba]
PKLVAVDDAREATHDEEDDDSLLNDETHQRGAPCWAIRDVHLVIGVEIIQNSQDRDGDSPSIAGELVLFASDQHPFQIPTKHLPILIFSAHLKGLDPTLINGKATPIVFFLSPSDRPFLLKPSTSSTTQQRGRPPDSDHRSSQRHRLAPEFGDLDAARRHLLPHATMPPTTAPPAAACADRLSSSIMINGHDSPDTMLAATLARQRGHGTITVKRNNSGIK